MESAETEGSKLGKRRARKQDLTRVEKNEAYQERRDEILQVARELFRENGVENTSIGDIATALNSDRATLYYYFSSKKDIFDAVVSKIAEKNVIEIEGIACDAGSPSIKLKNSMMALNRSYKESYPLLQMYLNDFIGRAGRGAEDQGKNGEDWSVRYYRAIRSIIAQGVEEGEFSLTLPIGMTALGLIGMLNWSQAVSLGSEKSNRSDRLSPDEVGAGFASLVFSGIRRKPISET